MDLLQSVRKEGSRGGVTFSWDDVKGSQHRENYLGHSLMAPVGRWQKNKDLSWYAKKDAEGKEISEADARKEEIRRVKEAEEDALAKALGYDPPPRSSTNANLTELGERVVQRLPNDESKEEEFREEEAHSGESRHRSRSRNRRERERSHRHSRRHDQRRDRHRDRRHERSHGSHRDASRSRSQSRSRDRRRRSRSRERRRSPPRERRRRTSTDRRDHGGAYDERAHKDRRAARMQSDAGRRNSRSRSPYHR